MPTINDLIKHLSDKYDGETELMFHETVGNYDDWELEITPLDFKNILEIELSGIEARSLTNNIYTDKEYEAGQKVVLFSQY